MLSNPRWTIQDTLLAILAVLMAARVFEPIPPGSEMAKSRYAAATGHDVVRVTVHGVPAPTNRNRQARLEAALRCIGLAEAHRQQICRPGTGAACRAATRQVTATERELWPRGRDGEFALAYRGQADAYARAYLELAGERGARIPETSRLILSRDNAMCRRYRDQFEARLHVEQDRQPG